jgi:hypothetical protein
VASISVFICFAEVAVITEGQIIERTHMSLNDIWAEVLIN